MIKSFSPSINIVSNNIDISRYIVTPNVQNAFDTVIANYQQGIRSFNLIGAYGTGKSTFLSAFESHLNKENIFEEKTSWKRFDEFETIKIVGDYYSLLDLLSEHLGCRRRPKDILDSLDATVKKRNALGHGLLLIIDEFGKFLEYAAKNDPEIELYFLQQLAEFANDTEKELLLITTLHQDFSAYSVSLTKAQRNEWVKVKGRFKEISFNEPVEQLIYLASQRLHEQVPRHLQDTFDSLFQAIEDAKIFPLRDYFKKEIAQAIYPFDILSCSTLALALQQYGQNERSLFTFLDSYNYLGIHDFDSSKENFYALRNVYDYLNHNFNSFLKSKANPDYSKWASIRIALERVEGEFDYVQHSPLQHIVKTIGLLNIFSSSGARLDESFLVKYIEATSQLQSVQASVKELERKKIIRYNKYSHRYILFDSTEIDIDSAIDEAAKHLNRSNDVVSYLGKYFSFPTITAKKAYFEKGTPRIFEFKLSETPYRSSMPTGEVDGYINLIFSDSLTEEVLEQASTETSEAILYGWVKNTEEVRSLIEEIQKAEIVKERHVDDRVVQRELTQIIDLQKHLLNHYVLGSFYNSSSVVWYFSGRKLRFRNSREFNTELSRICDQVYSATPVFKSELANKTKLSAAISTARKALIKSLIEKNDIEAFGIPGYPPEKSIYMSFLKETGIHSFVNGTWRLGEPMNDPCGFIPLFEKCDEFVESSKGARRSLAELYDILSMRPFKLKKGFLDFWIPVYLFVKSSDFALYGKNGFIPEIDEEVLELLVKQPKDYSVKGFDVGGVKVQLFNQYRSLLNLNEEDRTSNSSFIQTIIPFIKFYRELPDFAKQTKKLAKSTIKVRQALTEATDPEKLFFEDFPNALGFDIVQLGKDIDKLREFSNTLQNAIRELRSAHEDLLVRFEHIINSLWNSSFTFPEYKEKLKSRYSLSLRQHLLLPQQKSFYQRLCSPLEDRSAWLSSIAQAAIGKTLDKITDQDETRLFESFLTQIRELDNLNDIAVKNVNLEEEEVFKVEISAPGARMNNKIIIMPKKREQKINDLEGKLKGILMDENKTTKIAILAELLKRELDNESN